MISIDGKQIKLQIWDTVRYRVYKVVFYLCDDILWFVTLTGWTGVVQVHYSIILSRGCWCSVGV